MTVTSKNSVAGRADAPEVSKKVSIIVSRNIGDNHFRLVQKKFKNGNEMIMFPSKNIEPGHDATDAAYVALLKCKNFNQITFLCRFEYEDNFGKYEVFLYSGNEIEGSGLTSEPSLKRISASAEQIKKSSEFTALTKVVLSKFLEFKK